MVKKWAKTSIGELEEAVRHHNTLYFVKNRPEISDEEFDRLVETLKRKKPGSPVLREIGSDVSQIGKTVKHETLMLSLDKCYNAADLNHWASKFEGEVVASPKIDGCAVSLRYNRQGVLAMAATRGSGIAGEIITPNVKYVQDIPKQIRLKNAEVRGEIYMPLSVFKRYAVEFANPRNLAAGAIKQKDPRKTGEYNLSFFSYDLLNAGCKTEAEKRKLLTKEKFPVVEWKLVAKEKIQKVFEEFFKKREKQDYETDGVVYKTNSVSEQERLGATAHHPRFAIAYKFQGDFGETVLRDVLWSVSRTGTITPVGRVEPVELSGATVTRVSLHNFGMAKKMGVTIPAKVLMVRRGGVIPYLEKVVEAKGKELHPPKKCPSCGSAVELRDDFLYCTNPKKCAVTKIADLDHFVKVVDIEGFGRKHLQQLYENGLIKEPADFYLLRTEDLVPLERMGETLAAKLVAHIDAKRKLPLDIFLRALSIPELGKHVAKILAGFGSLEKVLKLTQAELVSIHGIGEKIAAVVVDGLKEKRPLIDRLLKHIAVEKGVRRLSGGPLAGKSFLFTGALLAMPREQAQAQVEAKGGTAASGVSKNLDYLVVGAGGGAGSKLDKAKKLQAGGAKTKILSEKEFKQLLGL
ncbi:MAG: NAD-dependent DNA ligase LigA [Deltaproteobacteria bacterium]|nr:NAD-dependent DNA ligase LigA [Deltaproteobacteria bacterium]MBI4223763.1 NAD-dependent DNA ligase LigA [Deltaproteobacteria bacterium]